MSYKHTAYCTHTSQGALRSSTVVGRQAMHTKARGGKEEAKLPDMAAKVDRARGGGGGLRSLTEQVPPGTVRVVEEAGLRSLTEQVPSRHGTSSSRRGTSSSRHLILATDADPIASSRPHG